MAATFFFLESPDVVSVVANWFDQSGIKSTQAKSGRGCLLHLSEDGPIASLWVPRTVFGSLATMGEVHFLTAGEARRESDGVARSFRRWLKRADIATPLSAAADPLAYYLEGSIRNIAPTIYALPSGLAELDAGRYFITDDDAGRDQSALCKRLRLRGVACG